MRNLLTPRWMLIKTALFLVLAAMAGGLLVAQEPTWTTVVCMVVVAWRAAAPTTSRSGRRPRCVALGWHDPGGRQRDLPVDRRSAIGATRCCVSSESGLVCPRTAVSNRRCG